MRVGLLCLTVIASAVSHPLAASDKADIDTSPRVFAAAGGKYWVRVTTKREWGGERWNWTTTMALSHAEGGRAGYAADKVVAEFTLDVFPARVLVTDRGEMITLGHFGGVNLESTIAVYGPDGKKRGASEYMEFLEPLKAGGSGSPRQLGYEILRDGKGAEFSHTGTDEFLTIPLPEGKVAKLSLRTGRPAK